MRINIVVHGPSVKSLEDNIHQIDTRDVLWASLNKIGYVREKILSKIGADLSYAYFSDTQFVNEYSFDCLNYNCIGNKPKSVITTPEFMRLAISAGKGQCFVPPNGQLIYSSYAEGVGIDGRNYNSFTGLILTLISLGFRDFGVFGLDGGSIDGQPLYCDCNSEARDGITMTALEINLARDTAIMNQMFWKEVDRITSDHVRVVNYSPKSHVNCFVTKSIVSIFKGASPL